MSDKVFVTGMVVKRSDNAPEYVLANLSIRIDDLVQFLRQQEGEWVNVVLKRAKSGKYYAEVDTWKPPQKLTDVVRGTGGPPRGAHWPEAIPKRDAAQDDELIPF